MHSTSVHDFFFYRDIVRNVMFRTLTVSSAPLPVPYLSRKRRDVVFLPSETAGFRIHII
jgi:hypothetical protein